MKVISDMAAFTGQGCVLALGTFDGVHAGHRVLIGRAVARAAALGTQAVVLTFDRHPLALLAPERAPRRILTNEQKRAILEELGVDVVVEQTFDRAFASLTAQAFIRRMRACLRPAVVVVGYNYTFGQGGHGDPEMLARCAPDCGFSVEKIEQVLVDGRPVSSTAIRECLARGEFERARRMLGGREAERPLSSG